MPDGPAIDCVQGELRDQQSGELLEVQGVQGALSETHLQTYFIIII